MQTIPSQAIVSRPYLSRVNEIAPAAQDDWFLYVNVDKTDIKREIDGVAEKGGRQRNLDPCSETLRNCFAEKCFRYRFPFHVVPLAAKTTRQRLRLYDAFVRPVLLYNAGTWGLTVSETDTLNAFHRKNSVFSSGLNGHKELATKNCMNGAIECRDISTDVIDMRWRLFGHVLRLDRTGWRILHKTILEKRCKRS